MIISDDIKSKELILEYPCMWDYRLLSDANVDVQSEVKEILGERKYTLSLSKTSRAGAYKSYSLSVEVTSTDDRKGIYDALSARKNIKFIL